MFWIYEYLSISTSLFISSSLFFLSPSSLSFYVYLPLLYWDQGLLFILSYHHHHHCRSIGSYYNYIEGFLGSMSTLSISTSLIISSSLFFLSPSSLSTVLRPRALIHLLIIIIIIIIVGALDLLIIISRVFYHYRYWHYVYEWVIFNPSQHYCYFARLDMYARRDWSVDGMNCFLMVCSSEWLWV